MFKILDTNILLLDAFNLVNLGKDGSVIVLPETVLDEIDSKKSGFSEIAYQARRFGRLLDGALRLGIRNQHNNITEIKLTIEGVPVYIISMHSYPEFYEREPKIENDRRIIHVAELYKHQNHLFVSNDVMCRLRAESLGLTTSDHRIIELTDLRFIKPFETDLSQRLHMTPIIDLDQSHTPQDYNYMFTDPVTEQTKLGYISNGKIQIIGKETETDLARQDFTPMNAGHKFLSMAIMDPAVDIVVCDAKAGTGKTATAVSNAIRLVRKGEYESISYIRASIDDVPKEEENGFRSGNEEKDAPFFYSINDTLDAIVRNRHKSSKRKGESYEIMIAEEIEKLEEQCNITKMTGLGMRGRTFRNTIAIIDEAQGISKTSLQKIITRFGENCKVIIIGSNNQIDNPYLTKYTNGLSTILDACTREHPKIRMHAVNLTNVVRSDIAEFAEDIFTERKAA